MTSIDSFVEQIDEVITKFKTDDLQKADAISEIGRIAITSLGDDETLDQQFPKQWKGQENLKKSWVNSRNHLRRSLRSKFNS